MKIATLNGRPVYHWPGFQSSLYDDLDRALILWDFDRHGGMLPRSFMDSTIKKIMAAYCGNDEGKLTGVLREKGYAPSEFRQFVREEISIQAMIQLKKEDGAHQQPPQNIEEWLASLSERASIEPLQAGAGQSAMVKVRVIRSGMWRRVSDLAKVPLAVASEMPGWIFLSPSSFETTDRVPATLGVRFGFDYEVTGLPPGAVSLRGVIITPPLHKPKGVVSVGGDYLYPPATPIGGRIAKQADYSFDHDYELVPGKWTFQVWRGKQMLAAKTFEVYRP